jgi:hypothetical protein
MGDQMVREKERAAIMAERHPGINFSTAVGNPLGIKQARKRGLPGAGLPRAIWYRAEPIEDPYLVALVLESARRWQTPAFGYVTYTTVQEDTGIDYHTLFGVIEWLRQSQAHTLHMSIDRAGKNTCFKVVKQ